MEGTARIWFTPQQRAELWERWKNGQCVANIARGWAALGRLRNLTSRPTHFATMLRSSSSK